MAKRASKEDKTETKAKKETIDNNGPSATKKVKEGKTNKADEEEQLDDIELDKEIKRDTNGKLVFPDFPDFKPNLTPKEVMQLGSFGGTYYRPIKSSVTEVSYGRDVWKEFPEDWFSGLNIAKQVTSSTYKNDVNKYQVKCGGSLQMWEESGWIKAQDPYGWFQWYCRFYRGRRSEDDQRQVQRWLNCTGPKGRWKNNLIGQCVKKNKAWNDKSVSPVIRQTLQHWGYVLNEKDFNKQAKNVKK